MTPWQRYLWTLAHPDEPPPVEDRPVEIQDECPATDGLTDEELMACAAARSTPRVAPDELRCAAVVRYHNGQGDGIRKGRCRRYARLNGFCFMHRRQAGG